MAVVQCRATDAARPGALRTAVAAAVRRAAGVECEVVLAPTALADLHHLGQAQPRRGQGGLSERRHPRHRGRPSEPRRARAARRRELTGRALDRRRRLPIGRASPARPASSAGTSPLAPDRPRWHRSGRWRAATTPELRCRRRRPSCAAISGCRVASAVWRMARTRSSTVAGAVARPARRDFHAVNARRHRSPRCGRRSRGRGCSCMSRRSPLGVPAISPYAASKAAGEAAGAGQAARPPARRRRAPAGGLRPRRPGDPAALRGSLTAGCWCTRGRAMRASRCSTSPIWRGCWLRWLADPTSPAVRSLEPDDGRPAAMAGRELAAIAERATRRARCAWSRLPPGRCWPLAHGWPSGMAAWRGRPPILSPRQGARALPSRLGERYARAWLRHAGWRPRLGFARRAGADAGLVSLGRLALTRRARDGKRAVMQKLPWTRTEQILAGVTAVLERYNTARHRSARRPTSRPISTSIPWRRWT